MKRFILLLALIFTLSAHPTLAGHDLIITCTDESPHCQLNSALPLLDEANLYPGYVKDPPQKLTITNLRHDDCQLSLRASDIQGSSKLSENTIITVSRSGHIHYHDSLSSLKNTYYSVGSVPSQNTLDYLWTVSLAPSLGNDFQNLSTTFSADFNFICQAPSSSGTVNGTTTSSSSSSDCRDSVPLPPTGFYARLNSGHRSVYLKWNHSSSPHTGYLIAYGPDTQTILYGHPDVGNVQDYNVAGLTRDAQYCFYVRTLNGCAVSQPTQFDCVSLGSTIPITNPPPTGFQPNILGEVTAVPSGQVQGETNSGCSRSWPYFLALALVINFFYLHFQAGLSFKNRFAPRFILPLGVTALALVFDYFSNRSCYHFPVVWSLVSLLFPYFYYSRLAK